jgi:hypothetical protein
VTNEYSKGEKVVSFAKSATKHLLNKCELVDEDTQAQRMLMCALCEYLKGQNCSICGCKVIGKGRMVKTKWPTEECPDGRWLKKE